MLIRSVVAAAATLTLAVGVMSSAAAAPDDPAAPTEVSATDEAEAALADAQALLDDDPATQPRGNRDATLVLRDLAARTDQLSRSQRASADRLLARPAAQRVKCGKNTCVHWVVSGSQAPSPTDTSPANGVPDFVDRTLAAMERVHRTYVRAGYRAPLTDGRKGGNKKRDVYLRDIDGQGLYGYCTTDQKPRTPPDNVWAFCVLDNDYASFVGPGTPSATEFMQVTAAHEYFHAVQFAYDFLEDGWFMEATATWAEDELYDDVNDNYAYLTEGQLGSKGAAFQPASAGPREPLDGFLGSNVYGNWIFFRYLTERLDASKAGMPVIVRNMWRLADAKRGKPDQYSIQAIKHVLKKRHRSFAKTYASFADANRRSHTAYDEGAELDYPVAPAWSSATLGGSSLNSGIRSVRLDHLTSATARFNPGSDLTESDWRLRVTADLAAKRTGAWAVVTVYGVGGGVNVHHLRLNRKGIGRKSVGFADGSVDHVDVTLVNASTRYRCGVAPKGFGTWACSGRPKDNNQRAKVRAVAFR